MKLGIINPNTNKSHQYGVAMPTNSLLIIIQTYESRRELSENYTSFYQIAKSKNMKTPLPVEKIPNSTKPYAFKFKILEDILKASERTELN